MNAIRFALLGAASGALATGAVDLLHLGAAPGLMLFGNCFGVDYRDGRCIGAPGATYVFPGLIFGLLFALFLRRAGRLRRPGAALFAVAAAIANAVAVFVFATTFAPTEWWLGPEVRSLPEPTDTWLLLGVPGAIAGAVGGGLLGVVALRLLGAGWIRAAATGTLLGPLVNLIGRFHVGEFYAGDFAFYMVWQAGYAAVLLSRPPRNTGRDRSDFPA